MRICPKIFIIICACLVFVPQFSLADEIKLSPTFSIQNPFYLKRKVDLLSMNSVWFELQDGTGSSAPVFQFQVTRKQPDALANLPTVDRFWKADVQTTFDVSVDQQNIVDKGCAKVSPRSFSCARHWVAKDLQFVSFVSEKLIWNAKNDLVLVRISSIKSFEYNNLVLQKFVINQSTRLPAAVTVKKKSKGKVK
jgi:hypothetical protein